MPDLSRAEKNRQYMHAYYKALSPDEKAEKRLRDYRNKALNWINNTSNPDQLLELLDLIKERKAGVTHD